MEFKQQDFIDKETVARLINKIDNIDAAYVNSTSDEIYQKQPFLLSVLLGYKFDLTSLELEEIMKLYFVIWEYFKDNRNVQTNQVTSELFEKIENRNIQMLKYAEDEPASERQSIYEFDLQKVKSKALTAALLFRFWERHVLVKMDEKIKGPILIAIKTFIECFETV